MFSFLLNLPYTIVGLLLALVSVPANIKFNREPVAIIVEVKSFWWSFAHYKRARAMALGHVVLIGPTSIPTDLPHELVHVAQHARRPVVQPILYFIELFRHGYTKNKFEKEAYDSTKRK